MAAVHAQLVLTLRNLPPRELELSDVRQLLLSFMYLQRRYKWNQPPPKPPHAPLPVAETQLFDILQKQRRAIVGWLEEQERKGGEDIRAVQQLLHEIFEAGTGDLDHVTAWARFDGAACGGRYASVVFKVMEKGMSRPPMPQVLHRVSEREPDVEVNVQLLQVTMKGRFLQALEGEVRSCTS